MRTDDHAGQQTRLRLRARTRPGTFDFLCDVFCGDGHEDMGGKIHVVPEACGARADYHHRA